MNQTKKMTLSELKDISQKLAPTDILNKIGGAEPPFVDFCHCSEGKPLLGR